MISSVFLIFLVMDFASNAFIRFLSSSATKKIFTARVLNFGRNFPLNEKIHPEFQTKALNLKSTFLIRIKFEEVRQIKTEKDNYNDENRCF